MQEKYTQSLSESQASGSETDPNQIFFDTVGGFRKGEVLGFGKEGASLYYERTSRRRHVGSSYSPSVSAQLERMSERLEESERARAEMEERERRREEYLAQVKAQMDAFMRQFGDPSFIPRRPPDDPTDGSGASGAFVA